MPCPRRTRASLRSAWVSRSRRSCTLFQAVRRLVLVSTTPLPWRAPESASRCRCTGRDPAFRVARRPAEGDASRDEEPIARQLPWDASRASWAIPDARAIPDGVVVGNVLSGALRLTADVVVVGERRGEGRLAAARLAEAGREGRDLRGRCHLHSPDFDEDEGVSIPCSSRTTDRALPMTWVPALLQGGAVGVDDGETGWRCSEP